MTTIPRMALMCSLLSGGAALADPPPDAAHVLPDLHRANLEEIQMGRIAVEHAGSKEVAAFGKVLIADHTAADKEVVELARAEKVALPTTPTTLVDRPDKTYTGTAFDDAFARDMLRDHDKDVAAAIAARDATTDVKLKHLLTDLVPILQKHQATAQKLVARRGHRS